MELQQQMIDQYNPCTTSEEGKKDTVIRNPLLEYYADYRPQRTHDNVIQRPENEERDIARIGPLTSDPTEKCEYKYYDTQARIEVEQVSSDNMTGEEFT